jgi:outer membrane lipoprotein SlyB
MKRLLTILLVLLLLASAGWYFGSPWWTLRQIQVAAQEKDVRTLNSYVDYAAVRGDVKAQFKSRVGPGRIAGPRDVGDFLASTMAQGVAEALVRPEGMRAVFVAGSVVKPPFEMRAGEMKMQRDSFDQFSLVQTDGKDGALVFRRYGWGWKLAGVRIPRGALKLRL